MPKKAAFPYLHPLGERRATIKAHPATSHHSRPYRKGISPERMESRRSRLFESPGGVNRRGKPCYTGKNETRSQKARKPLWTILHFPPRWICQKAWTKLTPTAFMPLFSR